jgi:rubredoxin
MAKKWILKSKKMMCPKCKGTEDLSRNEYVATNVQISVDAGGHWRWTGHSEVHWDTSDYRKDQGEREWRCNNCDIEFDAPNVKSATEKEAAHG